MATPTNLPAAFTVGQVATAAQMNDLRGAFRVLQVVGGSTSSSVSSTSTTFIDSGLTATITPQSTTSKILVAVAQHLYCTTANTEANVRLMQGTNVLQSFSAILLSTGGGITGTFTCFDLGSPASISALTYKTQFARGAGTGTVFGAGTNGWTSTIILMEISA